jgi:hypothetical protein
MLLLILEKRLDYFKHNCKTRYQHQTIPSHTYTAGFNVSTIKLWAVEKWNSVKQSPFHPSILSLGVFVYMLKRKHSLHSPSMVHSNRSLYVVFVDPL